MVVASQFATPDKANAVLRGGSNVRMRDVDPDLQASLRLSRTAGALVQEDSMSKREHIIMVPDDVKSLAPSVLRHRVTVTPELELEGVEKFAASYRKVLGAIEEKDESCGIILIRLSDSSGDRK